MRPISVRLNPRAFSILPSTTIHEPQIANSRKCNKQNCQCVVTNLKKPIPAEGSWANKIDTENSTWHPLLTVIWNRLSGPGEYNRLDDLCRTGRDPHKTIVRIAFDRGMALLRVVKPNETVGRAVEVKDDYCRALSRRLL